MQQRGFYDRVHKGYLTLAKKFPERYVVIDATGSIEQVASSVWNAVGKALARRNEETKK